jgi:hypothetical protein
MNKKLKRSRDNHIDWRMLVVLEAIQSRAARISLYLAGEYIDCPSNFEVQKNMAELDFFIKSYRSMKRGFMANRKLNKNEEGKG